MKKYFVLIVVALCCVFTACEEDKVAQPSLVIESESGSNELAQLDTLYLKVQAVDMPQVAAYSWVVDGKEISTAASYKFSKAKTGDYKIQLTVTTADGEKMQSEMTAKVKGRFGKGTFVLNEGNMTNETGTLLFIDSKKVLTDSAYYRVNHSLLGNTCQDLFIANQKIYILSQNGSKNGGEGLLTIANADNLEKDKVYNDATATLSWPTNIAVVGEHIYIRDGNGIYSLDLSTDKLTLVAGTKGALKNRMAVVGDKVFVMGAKQIFVIQKTEVVHTIPFGGPLSGIAKAYDGNLWVSCTSPASISKVNPTDYSTIALHSLPSGISSGWGVSPAFSAKEDIIYFSNASLKLYRHDFSLNETKEVVADMKTIIPNAGMYYNSLGVDPVSEEVYFATLKGYGLDYKINNTVILDFSKTPVLQSNFENKNSFPAGVFFTENFK